MVARVFDAMMLTNYWSAMKYQFRSWVRIKSDKIIREFETDWSPSTWLHSNCAMEANNAEKLTRVPIQKEILPRRRKDVFLSSAVFWNRRIRLSNMNIIYSPIYQVKFA